MIFVDTNYFLRLLLSDVTKQHQQAEFLFLQGAAGKLKLFTSTIVIFEIYWVLSSFYQKKKKELAAVLEKIFQLEFIKMDEKNVLQQALVIYKKTNFDLEDGYNLALAKEKAVSRFRTFDQKLAKYFKNCKDGSSL